MYERSDEGGEGSKGDAICVISIREAGLCKLDNARSIWYIVRRQVPKSRHSAGVPDDRIIQAVKGRSSRQP